MDKLLTVDDLCRLTGLKRSTIYAMVHWKRIPVIKISGRCVRFRECAIQAWLEAKTIDASADEPVKKAPCSSQAPKGSAPVGGPVKKARRDRFTKSHVDAIVERAKREVLS